MLPCQENINIIQNNNQNSILLDYLQNSCSVRFTLSGKIPDISNFIPSQISNYYLKILNDKASDFLNLQISKVNEFLNNPIVQQEVKDDFDNKAYNSFDVNHGDNNCQSRIYLYEIFIKQRLGKTYDACEPLEKLVLTLSHITHKFRLDVRDEFGLLIFEKTVPVSYKNLQINKFNVSIKKFDNNKLFTIAELIGLIMSEISSNYMISAGKLLNNSDLVQDLKPYLRFSDKFDKIRPAQQLQGPGIMVMNELLKLREQPIAYKITQLTGKCDQSNILKFGLSGSKIMVVKPSACDEPLSSKDLDSIKNEPMIFFELYSVITPQLIKNLKGSKFEKLASSSNLSEYLIELNRFGITNLISICDALLDKQLQDNKVDYKTVSLKSNLEESKIFTNILNGSYVHGNLKNGYIRNSCGVIFAPCHVFLSTFNIENNKLTILKNLDNVLLDNKVNIAANSNNKEESYGK